LAPQRCRFPPCQRGAARAPEPRRRAADQVARRALTEPVPANFTRTAPAACRGLYTFSISPVTGWRQPEAAQQRLDAAAHELGARGLHQLALAALRGRLVVERRTAHQARRRSGHQSQDLRDEGLRGGDARGKSA